MSKQGGTSFSKDVASANAGSRHDRFIRCLERHGFSPSIEAFDVMAEELGWSTDDVKLYAYRYLIALQEATPDDDKNSANIDEWMTEESILFEALLVQYLPAARGHQEIPGGVSWAERIASQMPGRTAKEINLRYAAKYSQQPTYSSRDDAG